MSGFDSPEDKPRTLGAITVLLTAAAGALNAATFFAFSGVFAGTMSGNLILIGTQVGQGHWAQVLEEVSAIGGYVVGLALCSLLCGWVMRQQPWRSAVVVALGVELGLLVVVGIGWHLPRSLEAGTWPAVLLIVGSAASMGVQAAACRYIGPSGTPTNFLTGTVTNWVSALADPNRRKWDGNSVLRVLALAIGAIVGALVQRAEADLVVIVPVALVAVSLVLMMRVVRANHGGLTAGEAQFPEFSRR